MHIEYRALTPADEPFLWEMLYQAIYVPAGQAPFPREIVKEPLISQYVEGWGRPDDQGVVALDGDKPVGAAWLRLLVGDRKGFGYVNDITPELSIAILPEYRGQGIGSKLLAQLLENVQSHYTAVCLSVSPDNPAMKLYERLGFEVVGESGSSLTMVKRWKSTAE